MLKDLLLLTAVPMEKPQAYGTLHLSFFLIGIAVCIVLAYLLRNANEKQNKIILLAASGFLILTEIYKHLFYAFVIGGEFQWGTFSFQLCSIPMYLCPIAVFLKGGKVKQSMYDFMVSYNLLGGFLAFLEPSGLLHDYWALTLHALVWHMTLVFIGLYLGFSGRAGRKLVDFKKTLTLFGVLAAMAFAFNLIFWKPSGGTIKMFFLGPGHSPIIVFKEISEMFGWYINTPLYLACLSLGAFVFFAGACAVNKKLHSEIPSDNRVKPNNMA